VNLPSIHDKTILFTVLNWGLGHATRSIPIIRQLLESGNTLTIASDGVALKLLQKEFPQLDFINMPGYNVRYGNTLGAIVFGNIPNVLRGIISEHFKIKRLVKNGTYDMVISDSRFGCFNRNLPCYIISHQLNIPSRNKLLKYLINIPNHYFLNRFDELWIPDHDDHSLSGQLSISRQVRKQRFIGAVSRLEKRDKPHIYDIAIILSGPEPSRSTFEEKIISTLMATDYRLVLVRGTEKEIAQELPANWQLYNLANSKLINEVLIASKLIISRSGYTSILDYNKLGVKAILVPTPGQSEQEYLAYHLNRDAQFISINEQNLNMGLIKTINQALKS